MFSKGDTVVDRHGTRATVFQVSKWYNQPIYGIRLADGREAFVEGRGLVLVPPTLRQRVVRKTSSLKRWLLKAFRKPILYSQWIRHDGWMPHIKGFFLVRALIRADRFFRGK